MFSDRVILCIQVQLADVVQIRVLTLRLPIHVDVEVATVRPLRRQVEAVVPLLNFVDFFLRQITDRPQILLLSWLAPAYFQNFADHLLSVLCQVATVCQKPVVLFTKSFLLVLHGSEGHFVVRDNQLEVLFCIPRLKAH